jgi:[protein-PII] uridylyltransferase
VLVEELVMKVASVLSGAPPPPRPRALDPALEQLVQEAEGGLLVRVEGSELVVVAPDRPGLFCQLAGVLSLHGLDVTTADAWSTDDGMAVDVFGVQRALEGQPDWARFQRDLARALEGGLAMEPRLAERAQAYASQRRPRSRKPAVAGVMVDNDASADASVVEVRGPDALGVLYRITRALLEMQLDIRHAKVLTLGHEVVDSFYVVDRYGQKLTDGERIRELERAVLFELSQLGL